MSQAFHRDFSRPNATGPNASGRRRRKPRIHRPRRHQRPSVVRAGLQGWRWPSPRWFPLLGAGIGFMLILGLVSLDGRNVDAKVDESFGSAHEEWLQAEAREELARAPQWLRETLKPGDTSLAALQRLGLTAKDAHALIRASKDVFDLRHVLAGHMFERLDSEIVYHIDDTRRLRLHRDATGAWHAGIVQRSIQSRRHIVAATIEDSLFAAASRAGLDERTTMNLVDIFAWDIDFARDIRSGDRFRVLYEEQFDEQGHAIGSTILAAEFVNQGHSYRAVRYQHADGRVHYYTPEGRSMRKAYLKAPVKFSRISSRFQARRKHPVLGYTRAHRGVDYAAPAGTPIHAVGDGRVEFAGWKGGYGRFILIRHTNRNHATAYAHMRSFAKGIRRGSRVHQGQVIGYVGMTGLATGPHLHFEFRLRGRAVNPLTIKRAPARPVPATELARFQEQTAPLMSRLSEWRPHPSWG